ncbi:MAG: FAD-dependent oxidoreductase, partial [Desulfobacterales bacterium]
ESGERIQPYKAPATGRRIAVVGGGVEGLAAAFFSARLGHASTVFEATPHLGGLLRSAIAAERLPQEILEWDLDGIVAMGVEAQTGQALGRDFTIASLLQADFAAVFVAVGGWDSRCARGAAAEVESPIPGTFLLLDLLKFGAARPAEIACQSEVVISGGGQLALNAAKICKDLGAQEITILFRESWQNSPIAEADVAKMGLSGVKVVHNAAVNRMVGEDDRLTELEYVETDTGQKTTVAAQTFIIAAGRFPELIFVKSKSAETEAEEPASASLRWEAVPPYKQPAFKHEIGMFAAGEVLADYGAAIKAIGAGRRAAASIHQIMNGIAPSLTEHVITPHSILQNVDHVEDVAASRRQIMPLCSRKDLSVCGEIEKGFTADMAQTEAARCLQCGLICYERSEVGATVHRDDATL